MSERPQNQPSSQGAGSSNPKPDIVGARSLRQERRAYNPNRHLISETANTYSQPEYYTRNGFEINQQFVTDSPETQSQRLHFGIEAAIREPMYREVRGLSELNEVRRQIREMSGMPMPSSDSNFQLTSPDSYDSEADRQLLFHGDHGDSSISENLLPSSPPGPPELGIPLAREIYSPSPPENRALIYGHSGDSGSPVDSVTETTRGFPQSPALRRQREPQLSSGSEDVNTPNPQPALGTATPAQQPEPVTPPSRPSDPPTAPRASRYRRFERVSRDLLPSAARSPTLTRTGRRARLQRAPTTEVPPPVITYPAAAQARIHQQTSPSSGDQRIPRRVSPTIVSPPRPSPALRFDISRMASADAQPSSPQRELSLNVSSHRHDSEDNFHPDNVGMEPPHPIFGSPLSRPQSSNLSIFPSPSSPFIPDPVILDQYTPIPVASTNRTLQETLRRVAASTPGGRDSVTTVETNDRPLPNRFVEWRPSNSPEVDADGLAASPVAPEVPAPNIHIDDDVAPTVGHGDDIAHVVSGIATGATDNMGEPDTHQHDQTNTGVNKFQSLDRSATGPDLGYAEPQLGSDAGARPEQVDSRGGRFVFPKTEYDAAGLHHSNIEQQGTGYPSNEIPIIPNRLDVLNKIIDSAEAVRHTIKLLQSELRNYSTTLRLDERALERGKEELNAYIQQHGASSDEAQRQSPPGRHITALIDEHLSHQLHHSAYFSSLTEELRKKEQRYRYQFDSYIGRADDPILDPFAGIPQSQNERTEEKEAILRGRLAIRAKLKQLGYQGGPVAGFLRSLDIDVLKTELKEAILASDVKLAGGLQGGMDINLENIDLMDLTSLSWGHFDITRTSEEPAGPMEGVNATETFESAPVPTRSQDLIGRGKENSLYRLFVRQNSPTSKSAARHSNTTDPSAIQGQSGDSHNSMPIIGDSSDDDPEEIERSIMTDTGITPGLKQRLQRQGQLERFEEDEARRRVAQDENH